MVAINNILLFVTAASALALPSLFSKRTASKILTDIATLESGVKNLTAAANAYQGGLSAALTVQSAEQALDNAIIQAGKDANATSTLSSADSTKITNAIASLIPNIATSIKAIENKKSQFTSDNVLTVVQNDLQSLKTDTDRLSTQLVSIAASSSKTTANNQKTTIDNDFAGAIKYFAS